MGFCLAFKVGNMTEKISKNVYYMLVGLPGSGKSTYFKMLRETYIQTGRPFVYCSTDDVIENYAEQHKKTYNEVFEDNIKVATKLVEANRDLAVKMAMDIIHDQTNLTTKKRKAWLDAIPDDWCKVAIVFEKPEETEWVNRLNSRPGKVIPEHILQSMESTYVKPTVEEGFDDVITIGEENA